MSKKERKKSQYQKKTDNLLIILGVAALIIIPYISFEFAYASDIYLLTFSQIAGRFGEQNSLIIWGISLLTFFVIVVMYVNTLLKNRSILLNILLGIMVFLYWLNWPSQLCGKLSTRLIASVLSRLVI